MPGILGVVSQAGPDDAARRFGMASARMLRHAGTSMASFDALDGRGRFGHVTLGPGAPAPLAPRVLVLFHGVLYNLKELEAEHGPAGLTSRGCEGLDTVLHVLDVLYRRFGPSFLDRLEGEFCLAVVDEAAGRVLVATDHAGTYPVRWHVDGDGFMFGSDLSALITATPVARRLNLRAVADYLTIGAVFGEKTLVEGVSELGPGRLLAYDVHTNAVRQDAWWRLDACFGGKATDHGRYLVEVREAFFRAVARAATVSTAGRAVGLSLSGGLDSRAILSAAGDLAPALRTYTLGVQGCADQAIANRLARIAGTQHRFFALDERYLRDFLPNMAGMVSLTDGGYLSHGLTEMLAIRFLPETGAGILLRGHGGELAKVHLAWPLHTDARVRTMTSLAELPAYLAGRANYITPGLALDAVFTEDAAARAGRGAADSMAEMLTGVSLTPSEACSYLYLHALHPRFTVPSLELLRTEAEVRLPFTDRRFLQALLSAPAEWRDSTAIHASLIAAGIPALARVRNSNTGAPADAGPRLQFILDKLNTLLKRLDVPGYRHYHNFDAWMRRMLLDAVTSELLAPGARVQQFVSRATLTRLLDETRAGAANRAHLLQVLLILELWQRENGVES